MSDYLIHLKNILVHFGEKVILGGLAALLTDDLALLFFLFVVVELLDIFTRVIAESSKLYQERKKKEGTVWDYIKYIPTAHRARRIKSERMRSGFCGKMVTYCIVLLLAASVDAALAIAHAPKMIMTASVTVLGLTEALSVLENLTEAGVGVVADIKDKILKQSQKEAQKDGEKK